MAKQHPWRKPEPKSKSRHGTCGICHDRPPRAKGMVLCEPCRAVAEFQISAMAIRTDTLIIGSGPWDISTAPTVGDIYKSRYVERTYTANRI